jgi:hypothetical protein
MIMTMPAVALHPNELGDRLGIPHAGDDALRKGATPDPVDIDVVSLGLEQTYGLQGTLLGRSDACRCGDRSAYR